ncbi:MAG: STAS domain-containing protein [Solirubrobacterales bacterium]
MIGNGEPHGFSIEAAALDDVYLIRLAGALDLASCGELMAAIRIGERSRTTRTVIDVEGLEFIDSTGLRLLLAANRRAELINRDVRFTHGHGYVAYMLKTTALDQTLPFVSGVGLGVSG